MNNSSPFHLGIDGGATTTRAVIIDADLQVLGRGEAPSSNHYSVGIERARHNIADAAQRAARNAGIELNSLDSWGLGLAGACTPFEQNLWREQLQPLCEGAQLVVDEDAAAAQFGAFGGDAGAICIAGTGANCFGIAGDGRRARGDGLGPLLGDRGSGYWIGEAALRAACLMNDGCQTRTPLLDAVLAALKVDSVDELVALVYQPDFEKSDIASLFPVVCRADQSGDVVATTILHDAGTLLAQTTLAVLQTLDLDRVALSGGVLGAPTPVRTAYQQFLQSARSGVIIAEASYDAAIGAALMSRSNAPN